MAAAEPRSACIGIPLISTARVFIKARAIQVAKGVARSDATQIASWCHENPGYQLATSAIAAVNGWAGPTTGPCSEGRLVRG